METLTGTIKKIIYADPSGSGYHVVSIVDKDSGQEVKATGIMPGVRENITVQMTGEWQSNRYGVSLKAATFDEILPTETDDIRKYLASGMIKNIGKAMADRIVRRFGKDTLRILDQEPDRLLEIKGMTPRRLEQTKASLESQSEQRAIMLFLKGHDLPNGIAGKIWKRYGKDAMSVLRENPYRLALDIDGVGFLSADKVASSMGFDHESPFRIQAGIHHRMEENDREGNSCSDEDVLIRLSALKLDVPEEMVATELKTLLKRKELAKDGGKIYLPFMLHAEKRVAQKLLELSTQTRSDAPSPVHTPGVEYSAAQKNAVRSALTNGISVLTGGPGTGKTMTVKNVIDTCIKSDMDILLAAPTGRAAKRMAEVTGQPASTIHRLLEYSHGEFGVTANNPLTCDMLIVDECSMIDLSLMYHLLEAVPEKGCNVLLVGDYDQLPSVGSGNVLHDIIDSGKIPVTRLTEIFRQAMDSKIITGSHDVISGKMPDLSNAHGTDLFFVQKENPQDVASSIVRLVSDEIPRKFNIQPDDIQVLSPMRRSGDPIAANDLNTVLQSRINPGSESGSVVRGRTSFRSGDRVMQMKNDYEKDVFNGDVGEITRCDPEDRTLSVQFDDKVVEYEEGDLENLSLSYATTVHKSQGSEYPAVVIPVHESQYIMLQRNLLFTAMTRAKKLCILVGTKKAISIACSTINAAKRNTSLLERLTAA